MYFKKIVIIVVITASLVASPLFPLEIFSNGVKRTQVVTVKASCEDDVAALIMLNGAITNPEDKPYYIQKLKILLLKIGRKYTTIILYSPLLMFELFEPSLFSTFLSAVADENEIRKLEDLKPFKVFLLLSGQSFYNNDLVSYIGNDGVSGVIFEASLIHTPSSTWASGNEETLDVCPNEKKLKDLLNSIQDVFGYKMKTGIAVDSYKECVDSVENGMDKVMSLFDMVVLNASYNDYFGKLQGNGEQHGLFCNCVKLFQKKFQDFAFYRVEELFSFDY